MADGRPVIAARVAQVCIEDVEPKNIEAYGVLSLAARSGKKLEQAAVEASRAVFLDPRNAEARARFTSAVRELAADVSAGPIAFGARHLLSRMTTANNRAGGAGTTRGVDIVQQMHAPTGAELHIIETARLLRRHVPTRIWSVGRPHPRLLELDPTIETIAPDRLPKR